MTHTTNTGDHRMTTLLTPAQREALDMVVALPNREDWKGIESFEKLWFCGITKGLASWLLAADARLRDAHSEDMAAYELLEMVKSQIAKLGVDMSGVPPMFYPEAICAAVRRYADPEKLSGAKPPNAGDKELSSEPAPAPTALTAREKWLMVEAVQEYADNGHWAGGAATACVTEWLAEVDVDGRLTVEHMLAREAPAVSA